MGSNQNHQELSSKQSQLFNILNPKPMQQQQPKQQYFNLIYSHSQWNGKIRSIVQDIANKVYDNSTLIKKLGQFSFYGTSHREYSIKKFNPMFDFSYKCLLAQYKNQLPLIFSDMAKLILEYENKSPKFPILYAGTAKQHTYTKKQMLLLTSMMSMNLIPTQDFQHTHQFPGSTDFRFIFSEQDCKTPSIIEYLKQEFKKLAHLGPKYDQQKLTLKRLVFKQDIGSAVQKHKQNPMNPPIIAHDKQSIQQYFGEVKVDFANKYIGGGSFGGGCVQQQIMFINHPEMYSSALFCEVMKPNEAIEFIGYKKYWKNTGYAHTTAFDGEEPHKYEYDQHNRAKQKIVAIDALHFPSKKHFKEFSNDIINRELLKAYVGFLESGTKQTKIITGNWGCGAFNGDIPLKFIIQWLASSLAGKTLVYVPFGYKNKIDNQKINNCLSKMTVGQVYKILMESEQQLQKKRDVFQLFQSKLEILGYL